MRLQLCTGAGVCTTGFLLRPATDDRSGFKEAPLSTSALTKRLQHHLDRLGMFAGESSHGVRRGTVIHDHQQLGQSAAAAGRRLLHNMPGGPQTLVYLDTSRETQRSTRKRQREDCM